MSNCRCQMSVVRCQIRLVQYQCRCCMYIFYASGSFVFARSYSHRAKMVRPTKVFEYICPHCGRIWYSKERLLSGVLGYSHNCGERVTTHKSQYRMWCLQYERWVVYRIETIGGFSCAYNHNITDCNSTELEYLGSAMVVFYEESLHHP